MKSWSAGYEILRTYVRFAFWLTHKRIVVKGRNLIPKGKPIIFAPNHQNALMDPLALACTNPYQSVWLARADIFKSKAAVRFLKFLKLLPVYRIRDGKESLLNNEEIFATVISLLENKQTIALFPEAAHSGKRQMLTHKKAIPRIALEAEAKNGFQLGLQIIPVGISYSHFWKFNRSLLVQYGKPIQLKDFWIDYEVNPQKAMLDLREEIYRQLCPLTIQIDSKTHYQEYDNIRQLAGNDYSRLRFFCKNPILQSFYTERELISKLEQLEDLKPEQFNNLLEETRIYFSEIQKADISDQQIESAGRARWGKVLISFAAAILTLPLFCFGFVFNAIPFIIPRAILRRKVNDVTFLSTFNFVTGLVVFPLFYLIAAYWIFKLTGSWSKSMIMFILMPFGGKIAYQLLLFYRSILQQSLYLTRNKTNRNIIKSLLKQRKDLIDRILEKVIF